MKNCRATLALICLLCAACNRAPEKAETKKAAEPAEELVEVIINDSVINKNDPYAVIEPLWWTVNIYDSEKDYREGMNKFSENQQYVYAIGWYEAEVNNGGHDQFFYNSTGIVWKDALKGFEKFGMKENAGILKSAVAKLGGDVSLARERRQQQLDSANADFQKEDSLFYNTDLGGPLIEVIKANRKDFYFKGKTKKPTKA